MIYEKYWILWLLFLSIIGTYGNKQRKNKVCIIGGGMSGLVQTKQLSTNQHNVIPIVFEKGSDIGGQWRYTDSTDVDEHGLPVHSSVYKNLRVNGPKFIMAFPDYPEIHGENRSYVKHETVLEYLKNYTEHFNLRQYIKCNTLVQNVTQLPDKRWHIKTRNLNHNKTKVYICDAVVVCNGHFTTPNMPNIPGLNTFTGRAFHSHFYRKPDEFLNKTVVILGASESGIDIGIEMSKYAKTVYLSHRHKKITAELPKNLKQIPGVVAANGSDLIFSEGSRVKADGLIMCTGYLYDYPFLDKSAGITVTNGKYVHPLYKHFINVNNPTMAFIGIPQPSLPFMVSYVQAKYFVSLVQGKAKLPTRKVMLKDSQLPPGTPISKAHYMEMETFDYYDDIAKAAGTDLLSKPMRKALLIFYQDFENNPMYFKENELIIRDNGSVELIRPNKTTKSD